MTNQPPEQQPDDYPHPYNPRQMAVQNCMRLMQAQLSSVTMPISEVNAHTLMATSTALVQFLHDLGYAGASVNNPLLLSTARSVIDAVRVSSPTYEE